MPALQVRWGLIRNEYGEWRPTFAFKEAECPNCKGWSITLFDANFCPWKGCGYDGKREGSE